ncbi:MAG: hypothetical protein ACLVHV_03320 [Oscillospiraceae bacterium]
MIELLGGYCIKSDRKQFIMGQTRKDKAGHTRFKEPHYFSTMQGAVKEAIRRLLCEKVAGDEITTLRQFVDEADRLKAEFKEIIEPLSGMPKEDKSIANEECYIFQFPSHL